MSESGSGETESCQVRVRRVVRELGDALVRARLDVQALRQAREASLAQAYVADALADKTDEMLAAYGELLAVSVAFLVEDAPEPAPQEASAA